MMLKGFFGGCLSLFSLQTIMKMGEVTEEHYSDLLTATLMLLGGLTKWIEHQMEHFTDLGEDELQDMSEGDGLQQMLLATLHGSLVTFSIVEFKKMCQTFALESS